jgi:hypothetical protein
MKSLAKLVWWNRGESRHANSQRDENVLLHANPPPFKQKNSDSRETTRQDVVLFCRRRVLQNRRRSSRDDELASRREKRQRNRRFLNGRGNLRYRSLPAITRRQERRRAFVLPADVMQLLVQPRRARHRQRAQKSREQQEREDPAGVTANEPKTHWVRHSCSKEQTASRIFN